MYIIFLHYRWLLSFASNPLETYHIFLPSKIVRFKYWKLLFHDYWLSIWWVAEQLFTIKFGLSFFIQANVIYVHFQIVSFDNLTLCDIESTRDNNYKLHLNLWLIPVFQVLFGYVNTNYSVSSVGIIIEEKKYVLSFHGWIILVIIIITTLNCIKVVFWSSMMFPREHSTHPKSWSLERLAHLSRSNA